MPAALMEAIVEAERASSGQRALLAWPPHPFVMLVHPRMRRGHDPQRWLVLYFGSLYSDRLARMRVESEMNRV
jgi:hypothetical protein